MSKENKENYISVRRTASLFMVVAVSILSSFIISLRQELLIDQIFCLLMIHGIFIVVFLVALLNHRLGNRLDYEGTSYSHFLIMVLISCVFMIFSSFKPDFIAPFMIIAFLLGIVLDDSLAMAFTIYLVVSYTLSSGIGIYQFLAYLLMMVVGVLLVTYRKHHMNENKVSVFLFFTSLLNFLIPVIFYYLTYYEMRTSFLIYCLIDCICAFLFLFFALDPLIHWQLAEKDVLYENFLDDYYPLVQRIKTFSQGEYIHATRVSRLAEQCAANISVDVNVCKTAGFYYRLGKIEGEPEIDNAVRLLTNYCFPYSVISVLEEYEGIMRKPTSPESAIVHMVDRVVTKLELMDSDAMNSNWNQDMVIYQTLNELSSTGIYDESGLTMNQFLRVREGLVREEVLS